MKDKLLKLGERFHQIKDQLQTEEATKHSLIIPFFMALGYDPFNPGEIVPEYIADVGIKKGEKIDYAVMKDGKPVILVECKHWKEDLNNYSGQLFRYFSTLTAKFALLTNGVQYMFFTDIDEQNKLDQKPFFEFDITDLREEQIPEIAKFNKSAFDPEKLSSAASDLKYTNALKVIIAEELKKPSAELVRFFARKVFDGVVNERRFQYFEPLVTNSINQVFRETVSNRLTSALNAEKTSVQPVNDEPEAEEPEKPNIETTQLEIDGFNIVRAIAAKVVKPDRIFIRDNQSYCNVILDDNIRKRICILYFNNPEKLRFQIYGPGAKGDKSTEKEISSPDDIYSFADEIIKAITDYENPQG